MDPGPFFVDHPRVRAWLEIREPLERQLEPLGRAAMEALPLGSGERVLDVGCGIGSSPAALAQLVGPHGQIVGLDVLADALRVAASDPDLPATVSFVHGDAQTYPFAPASFDAVFSRFGVMFFTDPDAAFSNLRRALAPGGRLAFVCWRRLVENELDHLPLRAAAQHLPASLVSDTGRAGWFSFADPDYLRTLLHDAGFQAIELRPHDEPVRSGSLKSMVDVCSRVGALGAILREHPDLRASASAALERMLADRDGPEGPTLQAGVWIVCARVDG